VLYQLSSHNFLLRWLEYFYDVLIHIFCLYFGYCSLRCLTCYISSPLSQFPLKLASLLLTYVIQIFPLIFRSRLFVRNEILLYNFLMTCFEHICGMLVFLPLLFCYIPSSTKLVLFYIMSFVRLLLCIDGVRLSILKCHWLLFIFVYVVCA
jgi:hypothetical protein